MMKASFAIMIALFISGDALAGVVDGNGDELRYVEPHEPDLTDVNQLLGRLKKSEPSWVSVTQAGLSHEIMFLKTTQERCYLKEKPNVEVRAYFGYGANTILFCKGFFELSDREKSVTTLHELTHYNLAKIEANLGDSEESVTSALTTFYRKAMSSQTKEEFESARTGISLMIERFAEAGLLLKYANKKLIAPEVKRIPIFKSGEGPQAYFPAPTSFDSSDFVTPRFLGHILAAEWALDAYKVDRENLFARKQEVKNRQLLERVRIPFVFKSYEDNQTLFVKYMQPRAEGCGAFQECLVAFSLSRSELSDEFQLYLAKLNNNKNPVFFLTSNQLGYGRCPDQGWPCITKQSLVVIED